MTRSKSNRSINNVQRSIFALASTLALLVVPNTAFAGGKRVVVLDFDGPQSESFHAEVERVVKKSHTLIATAKWNKAAEADEIERLSEKNVQKLCKKVGLDGVITGKVEKRRDSYIIRLKVRECTTGEMVGNPISAEADGPRLDASAQRTLRDELTDVIDSLAANGKGRSKADEDQDDASADEDDAPAPKKSNGFGKKPVADEPDDEDAPPPKAKPTKGKKPPAPSDDSDADEDESPLASKPAKPAKPAKPTKPVKPAASDDEDAGTEGGDNDESSSSDNRDEARADASEEDTSEDGAASDAWTKRSPAQRAVDVQLGASFIARRLGFTYQSDLAAKPAHYRGPAAPGAFVNLTVYPLALGHKRKGLLANLGVTVMFDRVITLKSQVPYTENGTAKVAEVATTSQRYAVGLAFRHALGSGAEAKVITAQVRYGRRQFNLNGAGLPTGAIDVPNVHYTIIDPAVGFVAPVTAKVALELGGSAMLVTNTGQMQNPDQYGPATVFGIGLQAGGAYRLTPAIVLRAGFFLETIGMTFKGGATKSSGRDMDADVDVSAARDTYVGGVVTAGFAM